MEIRRIISFVLAVLMLFCNTIPTSAAFLTVSENETVTAMESAIIEETHGTGIEATQQEAEETDEVDSMEQEIEQTQNEKIETKEAENNESQSIEPEEIEDRTEEKTEETDEDESKKNTEQETEIKEDVTEEAEELQTEELQTEETENKESESMEQETEELQTEEVTEELQTEEVTEEFQTEEVTEEFQTEEIAEDMEEQDTVSGNDTISEETMTEQDTVSGNDTISDNDTVSENEILSDNGTVSGNETISDNSTVSANGTLSCNETVSNNEIYHNGENLNSITLSFLTEEGNEKLKTFATLQEAFGEIDRLALSGAVYVITLQEDVEALNGTGKSIDYTFPKKAREIIIESEAEAKLTYNKNLTINSNITLKNIILDPEVTGGTVALGNFTLDMEDSQFDTKDDNGNNITYHISGGGVGKGSKLTLTDCFDIEVGKISNLDTLVLDNTDMTANADITVGSLFMEEGETFIGLGKITATNVYSSDTFSYLVTVPKLTKNSKTGMVTKVEPVMTVTGEMKGNLQVAFSDGTAVGRLKLEESGLKELAQGSGIPFIKVGKVNPQSVLVNDWNGTVYKKSGILVFKTTVPQVQLSYQTETEEIMGEYETFADVITEINTQKTKRDYTITFLESDKETPVTFTMPKAGNADTLTLTAKTGVKVYYLKDMVFTSNVTLEDIQFVQVVAVDKKYLPAGETYLETHKAITELKKFYAPVKLTMQGAYTLQTEGTVTFNTPIDLNGSKKATLYLTEGSSFYARALKDFDKENAFDKVTLEGSIKDFATVYVTTDVRLEGYGTGTYQENIQSYKGAELNVTELNLSEGSGIIVGKEGQTSDVVTVGTLYIENGSLSAKGNASFTNVTLADSAEILVGGQKFTITGTLTSTTDRARLSTVLDTKKKTSVLQILGNVVLGNPKDKIMVSVEHEEDFYLGKTDENGTSYSNKLLTAPKADISAFRADADCVNGNQEYNAQYDTEGYILKKSGNDILVYYSQQVETAVYTVKEEERELSNYYISLQEAVTAIQNLKNPTTEYEIQLLQDVGNESAYEKITMPSQASKVKIYSTNGSGIYYNNDITLGCDTVFEDISLIPMASNGKEKGILAKGFDITFENITTKQLGRIDGGGKTSKVIFRTVQDMEIDGDIINVTDLEFYHGCESEQSSQTPTVAVTGKLNVTNLTFGECHHAHSIDLDIHGKGSIVKNIYSTAQTVPYHKLSYNDISITGEIQTEGETKIQLNQKQEKQPAVYQGAKLVLSENNKLASIKQAAWTKVEFYKNDNSVPYAQWYNGAVYYVNDVKNGAIVYKITDYETSGEGSSRIKLAECIDITQASAYIDMLADKGAVYLISIPTGEQIDTSVMDNNAISSFILPKKDKAAFVVFEGNRSAKSVISFTGDITVNGGAKLKDLTLKGNKDFSVKNTKNTDVPKESIIGKAELIFENIVIETTTAGNKEIGNLNQIVGQKNATKVTISHTDNSQWNMTGGITNVLEMSLDRTKLRTNGKSDISTLNLETDGSWVALGVTTIGSIENSNQNANSYLATYLVKNVPQMSILGTVTKPVKIQLYDMTLKKELDESYIDKPLVVAKIESAEKFISQPYAQWGEDKWIIATDGVKPRKDAKNYVYNDNISMMEVLLLSKTGGENWTETYVNTYAEAISIINNINNPLAEYKILLRNTTVNGEQKGNQGEIKTAVKNNQAVYGGFTLPQAQKAKSLTIASEKKEVPVTITYTGTLAPKCELHFENVILSEGKIVTKNRKTDFEPSNSITLALGTEKVTFGEGVSTFNWEDIVKQNVGENERAIYYPNANIAYRLVFSKITSAKGSELNLCGNGAYILGDATIMALSTKENTALAGKGKITIGDIEVSKGLELMGKNAINITNIKGDGELAIHTSYTNKEWKKATAQLAISGELAADTALTVYQYMYDTEKNYRLVLANEFKDILANPLEKLTAYQKLLTAPKLQLSNQVKMVTEFNQSFYLYKQEGGVYATTQLPSIEVVGKEAGEDTKELYHSWFFTWEQAVKEIDKLNHIPSKTETGWDYTILLHEDIGGDKNPLATLPLPSKAAKVTIKNGDSLDISEQVTSFAIQNIGNDEVVRNKAEEDTIQGIMIKTSSITLKTDLEIQVPIVAVNAKTYAPIIYTVNTGNYDLQLENLTEAAFAGMEQYEYTPQLKLTGSNKGTVKVVSSDEMMQDNITQITNLGVVTLEAGQGIITEELESSSFHIADGISGVGELILKSGVRVSSEKDINVKNLSIGESTELKETSDTFLQAKNITVSETTTMASSHLKAGTSVIGDGKVILNNIMIKNEQNIIEGKQDKNGRSQIQIQGTVIETGENLNGSEPAITIGLYAKNSVAEYVKVTQDMLLVTAPKAASSWFIPYYEKDGKSNMGKQQGVEITVTDEDGDPISDGNGGYKKQWVPTYGVYKSGSNVIYGKIKDIFEYEDGKGNKHVGVLEKMEARLYIGEGDTEKPYIEFASFEEAVTAIDSMALQKTITDENGKVKKVYEQYIIELMQDVNIGNTKSDGKFTALVLPQKAEQVVLAGNNYVMRFSGNLTLRCHTDFENINLIPMKAVKGTAVPTIANVSIGNFVMAWKNSNCDTDMGMFENLETCSTGIGTITGGAKGELHIYGASRLKANQISGMNSIRFIGDGERTPVKDSKCGQLLAEGNVTIKELHYQNMAGGILHVKGNLTTNVIYVTGENNAKIHRYENKTMKVNGITLTQKDQNGKTVKKNESVIYTEDSLFPIRVVTEATKSSSLLSGTKILSGNYLKASDWEILSYDKTKNKNTISYKSYVIGNNLYAGTKVG